MQDVSACASVLYILPQFKRPWLWCH